jgi:hypothetical protein
MHVLPSARFVSLSSDKSDAVVGPIISDCRRNRNIRGYRLYLSRDNSINPRRTRNARRFVDDTAA